jgi:hypothetical protein
MSGTYQISQIGSSTMALWPSNPLTKTPRLNRVGTSGAGAPIFAAFFTWDFGWSAEARANVAPFFESRYIAGGLYNALLPHPITGALVGFTGVAIEDVSYTINDVERDSWVDGYRVTLRVNLYATGSV